MTSIDAPCALLKFVVQVLTNLIPTDLIQPNPKVYNKIMAQPIHMLMTLYIGEQPPFQGNSTMYIKTLAMSLMPHKNCWILYHNETKGIIFICAIKLSKLLTFP